MKVLYRPQRGTLDESVVECKIFSSLTTCFEYLSKEWEIKLADICLMHYCYDERIDWETYIVCDCAEETLKKYNYPQAIGFLTFKES